MAEKKRPIYCDFLHLRHQDLVAAIITSKFNNGGGLLSSVLLFRDAAKIQNGRQRSTLKFLWTQNLFSRFFQGFTKIQNGRHRLILIF